MDDTGARPAGGNSPVVIAVFNQKGGVGKTTTAVNLAVGLAASGRQTLLVDLDSQSSATSCVRSEAPGCVGAYDLLQGSVPLDKAMLASRFEGLAVCGGSDELAGVDIELATVESPQRFLARALRQPGTGIELVVVDCPPALGMLPVNALAAADLVILPVEPQPLARDGLHKAWHHIHRIRENLNPCLEIAGILLTMADDSPLAQRMEKTIRAEFGPKVLAFAVPRDPAVAAASDTGLPVVVTAPQSPAALAYGQLTALILDRCARRRAGLAGGRPKHWHGLANPPPAEPEGPPGAEPAPPWAIEPDFPEPPAAPGLGRMLALLILGLVAGFLTGRWLPLP